MRWAGPSSMQVEHTFMWSLSRKTWRKEVIWKTGRGYQDNINKGERVWTELIWPITGTNDVSGEHGE